MVLCPKCSSPRLEQRIVFSHPDGIVREHGWSCRMDGCGWTGANPNHTGESGLLARLLVGIKVENVTEAMRSLQESGDLIIVKDGTETMEVIG